MSHEAATIQSQSDQSDCSSDSEDTFTEAGVDPLRLQQSGLEQNSSAGQNNLQRVIALMASPLHDENGSFWAVVAGLSSLLVLGTVVGLLLPENADLPTPWYRSFSAAIGYTYFLCWSVSFWPQVLENWKRKSTEGLSSDFVVLNFVGFACYTVYNSAFFWNSYIQELFRERYGDSAQITVQSNDVAFSIHALLLSGISLLQIVIYGNPQLQRPSAVITGFIAFVLATIVGVPLFLLVQENMSTRIDWLDYLYMLSFIKVLISLIKYIPQVVLNMQRRSTAGWSIWNIILDFSGGCLSDLQLLLDCADMKDFRGITHNFAKFGLGFVSIFFDVLFMLQHYVIYADTSDDEATEPLIQHETQPQHSIDSSDIV